MCWRDCSCGAPDRIIQITENLDPPPTHSISRKKKAKIDQKFTDIRLQIKRFSEANSLGVYGKARLMKQFNDRLEELGYDVEIVNKITENFLISNA